MDVPMLNGAAGLPGVEQVLDPRVLQGPEAARPIPGPGPLLFTEEAPLLSSVVGPGLAVQLREKAGSLPACCEATEASKGRVASPRRAASSASDSCSTSTSSSSNSEESAEERESDSASEACSEDEFLPAAPRVHLASASSSSVLSMICCF